MKNRFIHPAADVLRRYESVARSNFPPGLIDLPLKEGETSLGHAVSDGTLPWIVTLLELGADANAPDLRGIPPIIHAAISQRLDSLQLLLNHGADVEAADVNGRTALQYAFLFGDISMAAALLERGGNMFHRDIDGRSVIDYARAIHGDKDVKQIAAFAQDIIDAIEEALGDEKPENTDSKQNLVADLRGDPDFQRLDRIRQAVNFGFDGIGSGSLFLIIGTGIGVGYLFENITLGLVVIYIGIVLRLVSVFLDQSPKPSPSVSMEISGTSVREVSFILRAASRHALSRLDIGIDRPAITFRTEGLLWLLALIAPIAAVSVIALIGALAVHFTSIPLLGFVLMVIFAALVPLVPRSLVWMTEQIFSYGAQPLLVKKITARQSALSAHINSLRKLRQGGTFADGGVLYLRSFEFDGSFVSNGLDFELLLLHLFQGRAPLLALSADADSRGAINLKTDDAEWKSVIEDMLPRAGLILMIPATSKGVLEEMELLERDGWFDKTLFIAPPENDDGAVGSAWETMRLRPEFRHLEIPPYCETGFLFQLDRQGVLVEAGPLGIDRSPAPLVPLETSSENKGDPDTNDDDNGFDVDPGISVDGPGPAEGGALANINAAPNPALAQAPSATPNLSSATLATSTVQFASLSQTMQLVPQLTAGQFATLSGANVDGNGGDGSDGGGNDGGGGG